MQLVRTLVRSVLAEPSVVGAPRRVWRDWVLVAGGWIGIVLESLFRDEVMWRWPTLVLGIVLVGLVPLRRTHPLQVIVACFGGMLVLSIGQLATDAPTSGYHSMAVVIVTLYSLFRWASGRDMILGGAVVFATSPVAVVADSENLSDVIGGYAVVAVVVAIGLAVRYRGAARRRELEQVRAAEREHLARDLHDTVAHHVSAIAIRAQAGLAVAPSRPEAAIDALRVIEAEASRTLGEMRAMVGVLRRDEPAQLAPTSALADLHHLAAPAGDEPRVDVSIVDGLGDVGPTVATALFRIAQESVTNARRHARHATCIAVTVTAEGPTVRLRVADDGDPVGDQREHGGYGIIGMAERAELLGGTLIAGPGHRRGWVVTAELPT
jgi:signal transduction histidine kinase